MNHKRRKPRNARACCKLCKPYKANGYRTERKGGERWSDHKRRMAGEQDMKLTATVRQRGTNATDSVTVGTCKDGRFTWSDWVIDLERQRVT